MRLRYVAVSLLCLVAANASAQAKKAQVAKSPELRVDFTREALPNGLNVIYHVDHSTPVAAVLLWYNVGSKMEQTGRTGFAHLFEHMMFQGSKNVAKGQHWALLEAAGGRGGADINGTTNWDRTNYFEQVPSNQVELALWFLAEGVDLSVMVRYTGRSEATPTSGTARAAYAESASTNEYPTDPKSWRT